MDPMEGPAASTPPEPAAPDEAPPPGPPPGRFDPLRARWSAIPSTGRVLLIVAIVVAIGIVGELVGGRFFGWYTRRISSVDPLDDALVSVD
jgi:hypothetical protein